MPARKTTPARRRKAAPGRSARRKVPRKGARRYWSQRVTQTSNALDLERGVFTRSPLEMARSLKRSADRSERRKASPFRSAMSMLTFYENRAGRNLSAAQRLVLARAKDELRKLYGHAPRSARPPGARSHARVSKGRIGG